MSLKDRVFGDYHSDIFSKVLPICFRDVDGNILPSPYNLRESFKDLKNECIVGQFLVPYEERKKINECIKHCDKLLANMGA